MHPRLAVELVKAGLPFLLLLPACANLGALVCDGAGCPDAAADAATDAASDAATDGGNDGAPAIACGGTACDPATQECCLNGGGTLSCVDRPNGCSNGTDIFCDDPAQCPGGGTCWVCARGGALLGTSCNYQADIVANDHCDMTTARALCHRDAQCSGGLTCQPFDAGAGAPALMACQ